MWIFVSNRNSSGLGAATEPPAVADLGGRAFADVGRRSYRQYAVLEEALDISFVIGGVCRGFGIALPCDGPACADYSESGGELE